MIVRILNQINFNALMEKMGINNDTVQLYKKTFFISIIGSGLDEISCFRTNYDNVLVIKFDDLSEEQGKMKENMLLKLFSEEHARLLLAFMLRNKDKERCMIHCSAGISRSGAVGIFVNDTFGEEDYFTFTRNNPNIKPNGYILATLRKIYNESNSSTEQPELHRQGRQTDVEVQRGLQAL